jgi:hypothetical protein
MYSDQKQEREKVKALFDRLISAPRKTFPLLGGALDAPNDKGVYLIESPDGRVLHVGRTPRAKGGIRQRWLPTAGQPHIPMSGHRGLASSRPC